MEWLGVILSIFSVVISIIYIFFKFKFSYWKKRNVPHMEPSIPYGNIKPETPLFEFVNNVYKMRSDKCPFFGVYFLSQPIAVIHDLDLIKSVLIKDFNNFIDRGTYYNEKDDPLSAHLFSLDGEKWHLLRNKLSPTFTSGKMKFMFSTVLQVGNEFLNTMTNEVRINDEIEMKDILARFTTDVIGSCAFGIECNSLKDSKAEFLKYGRKVFDSPSSRLTRIFKQQFRGLSRFLRLTITQHDVANFFLKVVRETIDIREKHNIKRNDFMDLLVEMKNQKSEKGNNISLTFEEIAAEAFLFFLAGFETSSTTMSFAFYELAKNQEIQDKLRTEINEVLKKHNGEFTYDAMIEMKYLDQTISETLRKYPPLILLQRITQNDYHVPNTNFIIEGGTKIFIPVFAIHNDPEIYPEPEKFDPDRFSPEEVRKRHAMSFLGFGDGPRNCIGLRFGRMQARIGIAKLLKNFKFSIGSKTPINMKFSVESLLLSPDGGLWLKVEKL